MCTGVVNVLSTAWLGMAFISMLSERTTDLKAMSPNKKKKKKKKNEILVTWMLNLNTNGHVHIL